VGLSVFYVAGPPEAQLCGASRVGVAGGGNSAGQAAVWLAKGGARVTLLHRRADLAETMSDDLIRELDQAGVAIRDRSEIAALHGADGHLDAVTLTDGENVPLSFLAASSARRRARTGSTTASPVRMTASFSREMPSARPVSSGRACRESS
jgi:thioredoxin reductase